MHRSGGVNIMEISPVGCLRTQVQCRITLVAIHSTERPVLRKILFEVNEKLQEGKQKGLNSLCLFKKNITRSWSERPVISYMRWGHSWRSLEVFHYNPRMLLKRIRVLCWPCGPHRALCVISRPRRDVNSKTSVSSSETRAESNRFGVAQ